MFKSFYNALIAWNQSSNERQKLQNLYVFIVISAVLVAGVVSLISYETGQDLLIIPLIAAGIFFANAVAWNLLESVVVNKLSGRRKKQ